MADLMLPPALAADPSMAALATIVNERLAALPLSAVLVMLFDTVNASALPHLAEQFSLLVDGWELASTEVAQRKMIKAAVEIHRHKGTPWAVKQAFLLLGLGEVEIDEGRSGYRRDGTMRRDGFPMRGEHEAHWAEYRVRCHRQLTVQQAALARKLLANIAPARSELIEINFSSAALIRNGFAVRDGRYTRGSV